MHANINTLHSDNDEIESYSEESQTDNNEDDCPSIMGDPELSNNFFEDMENRGDNANNNEDSEEDGDNSRQNSDFSMDSFEIGIFVSCI